MIETATLAGGCFWCTEAVFKRLNGVATVMPGYTGGTVPNPSYEAVSRGDSGHTEAIQITFDPTVISYTKLLEVFWALHDPTQLNQQGHDVGTQYRSAIFYHSPTQQQIAKHSKKQLAERGIYKNPIVTEIVPAAEFYRAEDYHRDYYTKNSYQPYCQVVIDPKIRKLFKEFKSLVKEDVYEI